MAAIIAEAAEKKANPIKLEAEATALRKKRALELKDA